MLIRKANLVSSNFVTYILWAIFTRFIKLFLLLFFGIFSNFIVHPLILFILMIAMHSMSSTCSFLKILQMKISNQRRFWKFYDDVYILLIYLQNLVPLQDHVLIYIIKNNVVKYHTINTAWVIKCQILRLNNSKTTVII